MTKDRIGYWEMESNTYRPALFYPNTTTLVWERRQARGRTLWCQDFAEGWPWPHAPAEDDFEFLIPPSPPGRVQGSEVCTNVSDGCSAGVRIWAVLHARQLFYQLSCMLPQPKTATRIKWPTQELSKSKHPWDVTRMETFRAVLFGQANLYKCIIWHWVLQPV